MKMLHPLNIQNKILTSLTPPPSCGKKVVDVFLSPSSIFFRVPRRQKNPSLRRNALMIYYLRSVQGGYVYPHQHPRTSFLF